MRKITVDVTSDIICPWCYIGKRRLEAAIHQFKNINDVEFEIKWHPFQLLPDAPRESIPKKVAIERRFGEERAAQMMKSMVNMGKADGINFNSEGNTGNTFDAHSLVFFAQQHNKQNEAIGNLFKNYFELASDVTDIKLLAKIAAESGLNSNEAVDFIESATDRQKVSDALSKNRSNISGVPHYSIQNKHEVSGAQSPETFMKLFQEVLST